jgi:hypothetical protein
MSTGRRFFSSIVYFATNKEKMTQQIPTVVPPNSIPDGLFYDPPYLVATKVTLVLAWASPSNGGTVLSIWVPISPDPNYVNVGHFIRSSGEFPSALSVIAESGVDGYPEFIFIFNDPRVCQLITSFDTQFNTNNGDADGCLSMINNGNYQTSGNLQCEAQVYRGISPSTDFVVLGNVVFATDIPAPAYPATNPLYAVYAVASQYAVNLQKAGTDNDFAINAQAVGGFEDSSFIYLGPYHIFLATTFNGTSNFSGCNQPLFDKMSKADAIACCTQTPSFFVDPGEQISGNVTMARCQTFFPPSISCDPVLIQFCSDEVLSQPINLKNPRCGCALPPVFYATSNLLGPVECASQTCTSVVNAYRLSTQTATVCQITNCVINSNQINGNNLNINTILYEQNCGPNVTGKGTPGGSSNQSFIQFLTQPLILTILIIGLVIFLVLIIIGATGGGTKAIPRVPPPGARVQPIATPPKTKSSSAPAPQATPTQANPTPSVEVTVS